MNTTTGNLKSRINAAIKEAKDARPQKSYSPLSGEYSAVVEAVRPRTFSSGSFGYEIVYQVTDSDAKGRKVWENIVLNKSDGTDVPYSAAKLLRRLSAMGITGKKLENFALPSEMDGESDLDRLNGTAVKLKLEREIRSNGIASTAVKGVSPLK